MRTFQRFSHEAMATEFQIVFADPDMEPERAQGISQLVFAEISRMEEELSRFKPTSDVWRINGLRAGESVNVDFATLDCLMLAKAVHAETAGAFDATVGAMMQIWKNQDGSARQPSDEEIAMAKSRVGMHLIEVDESEMRVKVNADFLQLDFGAVGKGYALDQAVRLLEEHEVTGALLNAGESTLLAVGEPPEGDGWPVIIHLAEPRRMPLRDAALSCSGFEVKGGHLMDPRTGRPVPLKDHRSYVKAPTAALSDALSTAFMLMSEDEIRSLCARYEGVEWLS